jgi:hypothetical protein
MLVLNSSVVKTDGLRQKEMQKKTEENKMYEGNRKDKK